MFSDNSIVMTDADKSAAATLEAAERRHAAIYATLERLRAMAADTPRYGDGEKPLLGERQTWGNLQ